MEPDFERTFIAAELMDKYPPRFQDRNKQVAFQIACPPGCSHPGTIKFARYPSAALPIYASASSDTIFEQREDVFDYAPLPDASAAVEWHLNFASTDLFCAYCRRALAQDELQVIEHPVLGSLREALLATSREQLFTVVNGEPTPVVIMGVERRCEFSTTQDASAGRPNGLYGRLFSTATPGAVRKATRALVPPTLSNILAIEAPANGKGRYTRSQIGLILSTAYSGFRAAQIETNRHFKGIRKMVAVHTGFWGCGVYGNDRVLMVLMQLLAARLAGIDRIVFHAVDSAGTAAYLQGLSIMKDKLFPLTLWRRLIRFSPGDRELAEILNRIDRIGFQWGEGDGN